MRLPPASRTCANTLKSALVIKRDAAKPDKSNLSFKWQGGPAMTQGSFGDPVNQAADDYQVCIFDHDGLLYEGVVPAMSTCGEASCWAAASDKGYKYKDKAGSVSGLKNIVLKAGDADKNKVQVKGKGSGLGFVQAAGMLNPPVTARVTRAGGSLCVEGTYDSGTTIKKNKQTQFSGKQKQSGSPQVVRSDLG